MQQELRFQCRQQRSLEAITWRVGRRCAGKLLRIKKRSLISPAHLPFRFKAPTEVLFTLNQPPSALVYFYHCLYQTTSPFVSNRHEVMLLVTGICPVVLLLCQPRHVYQANFRQFSVNITHQMSFQLYFFHWIWALWLSPTQFPLRFLLGRVVCKLPPYRIYPCVKEAGIPSHHPYFPSFCFPQLEGRVVPSHIFSCPWCRSLHVVPIAPCSQIFTLTLCRIKLAESWPTVWMLRI